MIEALDIYYFFCYLNFIVNIKRIEGKKYASFPFQRASGW